MKNKLNKYIKQIPFPECCKWCRIIEELGSGECESVCPERFKKENGDEMKLSKAQRRALEKLTDSWQSLYSLKETSKTLDSLVNKGLAKRETASIRTFGIELFKRASKNESS